MKKLQTYAGLSLIATLTVIYHAFNSKCQFYPTIVYILTSKISLVFLLNMGLVVMCILWQLTKSVFLGSLREVEVKRLNEQTFQLLFFAMVTSLCCLIRIISFMGFLLILDSLFLYSSLNYLIQTRQASVSIFFSFDDMLMEGQWEKKADYTFYLELIRDLLYLFMYLCFFLVIFIVSNSFTPVFYWNYGLTLHLIRELYETFRNFKVHVADYIRYRKITSNMNDRFPDATPEELNASDATCIVCREEMTTAKKIICGHLFHVHCLRSWLERQHTCPTCRALVVPPENGTSTAGGQHGSCCCCSSAVYEKSYVYPFANTLMFSLQIFEEPYVNKFNGYIFKIGKCYMF
ncbi:hypothetical protein AAG906_031866 [Vitis piasezkii]